MNAIIRRSHDEAIEKTSPAYSGRDYTHRRTWDDRTRPV